MPLLLLADDDHEFSALLGRYFRTEGFDVDFAYDGLETLALASRKKFDLIVLDIMMPHLSGLEVLRQLRSGQMTPVLMLTALGEDDDTLLGFEAGADDYLGKPCNLKVLMARVRALLRRAEGPSVEAEGSRAEIQVGDLCMHLGAHSVRRGDEHVDLTSTEFGILQLLLESAGQLVAKAELSEKALKRKLGPFDRSLDMHISNLRQKLGNLPNGGERIKTVRALGYLYCIG